jgi:transposase
MEQELAIEAKYQALCGRLDESTLRLWAATEARSLGRGGVTLVAKATGLSRTTIHAGLSELNAPVSAGEQGVQLRARAAGGGRKKLIDKDASLLSDVDALVEPTTRGDPMSPLRWTCKSTYRLAEELRRQGHTVSQRSLCDLLSLAGFSLQSTRKTREGGQHEDRDAQFSHIARTVAEYQAAGDPVISVDTKKKELIGDFKNGGKEWQPKGKPEEVRVHDFIDRELGKVAPYGVYDLTTNTGWVSVGIDHDTAGIRRREHPALVARNGTGDLPECSPSADHRGWRWQQRLSPCVYGEGSCRNWRDELRLTVQVCHLPPGTSKWNKIEHRMFCHITANWRGRPLVSRQVVVNLIGTRPPRPACESRRRSMRTLIRRESRCPTKSWLRSPSSATRFMANGTTG